jgi:hypothetical protein
MHLGYSLPALAAAALLSGPLLAADLTKIERKLAKEPGYHSKPKYCLVVFGPEAKTKVWLVLDGKVLYVDRNGSGDLTEKGERFTARAERGHDRPDYPFAEFRQFPTIDRISAAGKRKYTRFEVTHTTIKTDFEPGSRDHRELKSRFEKDPTLTRAGVTVYLDDRVRMQAVAEWADRPEDAPVVHIDGPLTMAPLARQELRRGKEPAELQFCLGCRGLGKADQDAFAILDYDQVPREVDPVAEFRFRHKDPHKPLITVEVKLKRC